MKVTIIRTSSFGDIVLTEPIFEALKKEGYETELITKEKFISLVRNNPYIDNILFVDNIKKHSTDCLIDLQKNFISFKTILKSKYKRLTKVNKYYYKRFLYITFHKYLDFPDVITRYKLAVEKCLKRDIQLDRLKFFPSSELPIKIYKPHIALSLTSKWFTKSYPYQEELINLLLKNTIFNIVILGKNNIKIENNRVLNLDEKFNIDISANIIKNAKFIIAVDSLWMHIGMGLNIKTYAIFGSTTPKIGFISPYNMPYKIIQENLSCRPCTKIGKKKCPKKHFNCMRLITPEKIWEYVKNECNS